MAKFRLLIRHRNHLNSFARRIVRAPVEEIREEEAYETADPLVRAAVEQRYPRADMLVLKRYDCAREDDCIRVDMNGHVARFTFKENTGPLTRSCTIILLDAAAQDAVRAWKAACDERERVIEEKLSDYRALIAASRTFEDLLEVWPEVAAVRADLSPERALIAFSPDVVARIKADIAERATPAALT